MPLADGCVTASVQNLPNINERNDMSEAITCSANESRCNVRGIKFLIGETMMYGRIPFLPLTNPLRHRDFVSEYRPYLGAHRGATCRQARSQSAASSIWAPCPHVRADVLDRHVVRGPPHESVMCGFISTPQATGSKGESNVY